MQTEERELAWPRFDKACCCDLVVENVGNSSAHLRIGECFPFQHSSVFRAVTFFAVRGIGCLIACKASGSHIRSLLHHDHQTSLIVMHASLA